MYKALGSNTRQAGRQARARTRQVALPVQFSQVRQSSAVSSWGCVEVTHTATDAFRVPTGLASGAGLVHLC